MVIRSEKIAGTCEQVSTVPQGGTLKILYICKLRLFFRDQNFEFQYFWGFSKKYFLGGYEGFFILVRVTTKLAYI